MLRRLLPFAAVIPLGAAVGLLAAAQDWSTSTRFLVMAACIVPIALIGTPFAMGHLRRVPPASGLGTAASALRGVYYEDPFTPRALPKGLVSGRRSADPTALLPVVLDRSSVRGRTFERVIVVPASRCSGYYAALQDVPYDLALWPERRRTALHRFLRHLRARLRSRGRRGIESRPKEIAEPPPPVADRLIDTVAS